MKKPKDSEKLRMGLVELPLDSESKEPTPVDAAESRWDPWLLALARQEIDENARLN
jgi:hypothetical protein